METKMYKPRYRIVWGGEAALKIYDTLGIKDFAMRYCQYNGMTQFCFRVA